MLTLPDNSGRIRAVKDDTKQTTKDFKVSKRSVSPSSRFRNLPRRLSFGFPEYGYIRSDGRSVPQEYLARITSYKNNCTIVSPLQEDISLRVESRWEPFIPTSLLARADILLQAVTGSRRSFITRASSRRMWMGTSPMIISLKLRFEAVSDPYTEVVEPCRLLKSIASPSDPSTGATDWGAIGKSVKNKDLWGVISKLPALQPPGPTPFSWKNLLGGQKSYLTKTRSDIEESLSGGDFIMIELGTFLTYWNVVVRSSGVNYKIKFDNEGDPVSADANIVFETYEMPTVESIRESYSKVTTRIEEI